MNDPLRTAASMARHNHLVFGSASRVTPDPEYPKKGTGVPFLPSKKALADAAARAHYRRIKEWQVERGRDPIGDIIPLGKLVNYGGCSALWRHPSYTKLFYLKGE